jgi:hypothetical protein
MPLTDSLVAIWPFNEASGNALDASGGGNALTETDGTIGAGTGLVYPTARDLEAGDTEDFRHADSVALSHGNFSFTYTGHLRFESFAQEFTAILGKDGTNQREFLFYYRAAAVNRFQVYGSHTGAVGAQVTVNADVFGPASLATWYFFEVGHDAVANLLFIRINNTATRNTVAMNAAGVFNGTGDFEIGGAPGASPTLPFDGLVQNFCRWNRLLTNNERNYIHNGGAGRTVEEILAYGQPADFTGTEVVQTPVCNVLQVPNRFRLEQLH